MQCWKHPAWHPASWPDDSRNIELLTTVESEAPQALHFWTKMRTGSARALVRSGAARVRSGRGRSWGLRWGAESVALDSKAMRAMARSGGRNFYVCILPF